jgi:hypothetical protein
MNPSNNLFLNTVLPFQHNAEFKPPGGTASTDHPSAVHFPDTIGMCKSQCCPMKTFVKKVCCRMDPSIVHQNGGFFGVGSYIVTNCAAFLLDPLCVLQ